MEMIIDASNAVLGRLASFAAKQALLGNSIIIVNCEKAIVYGMKNKTIEIYKEKRARGSEKGPFFPSTPEKVMKRTIRGMLKYKKARGREALKRIRCYEGLPGKYEEKEKISFAKKTKRYDARFITLKEICKLI